MAPVRLVNLAGKASAVCTGQGNLENGCILQDHDQLNIIMINGHVHKAGVKEYVIPMQDATGVHSMTNEMLHLELKRPIRS